MVCLRCGRPLTNEKSRLAHLGPKCARKLAYEARSHSYSIKTLNSQKRFKKSWFQEKELPSKHISLYCLPDSLKKPYCKISNLTLPAIDINTGDGHDYWKHSYCLPLLEGIIYEVFEPLPEPRIFWLQVQDKQLSDISTVIKKNNK